VRAKFLLRVRNANVAKIQDRVSRSESHAKKKKIKNKTKKRGARERAKTSRIGETRFLGIVEKHGSVQDDLEIPCNSPASSLTLTRRYAYRAVCTRVIGALK